MGREKGRSDSSHHEQDDTLGCHRKQTQERQFWQSWGATPPFRKTKSGQSQESGRSPAGGQPAASAKEKGYAGADDFFDASTQKKEGFRSPASETLQ